MTSPTPPAAPQRPASRPPSLILVVLGVVVAMVCQFGTLLLGQARTEEALGRLRPGPTPTPTAIGPARAPTPTSRPSRSARPTQTTGPVEVTDEVERGVVLVSGVAGNQRVAGTGMVLTEDGLVLTNYHVVRSTSSLRVTIAATGDRYDAELVGRDATKDVALLRLDGASGLETVTLDEQEVNVGDVAIAAGNANGQGYVTANRGNVQALGQSIQVRSASESDPPQPLSGLIETDAAAWPGDSGGPMFDDEVEVLGMTTAGATPAEGTDQGPRQVYAVPIDRAMAVVDRIRAGDESGSVVIGPKAYLGVRVIANDNARAEVVSVEPGSPAGSTGLEAGDTILTLDGHEVPSRPALSTVLDGIEPGQTVTMTWLTASGVARSGEVTVTASPLN